MRHYLETLPCAGYLFPISFLGGDHGQLSLILLGKRLVKGGAGSQPSRPYLTENRKHPKTKLHKHRRSFILETHKPWGSLYKLSLCASSHQQLTPKPIQQYQPKMDLELPILPKQKNFIWLAWWNKLPTKGLLYSGNITREKLCAIWEIDNEDDLHSLRDCSIAQTTWNLFPTPLKLQHSFAKPIQEWLHTNLNSTT